MTVARGHIENMRGWWPDDTFNRVQTCPREREHQYGPPGYLGWHDWAEKRGRTHRQVKCECGLYLIHERIEAVK